MFPFVVFPPDFIIFSEKLCMFIIKKINACIKVQKDAFLILGDHLPMSAYVCTDKRLDRYSRNNMKSIKRKVKKKKRDIGISWSLLHVVRTVRDV